MYFVLLSRMVFSYHTTDWLIAKVFLWAIDRFPSSLYNLVNYLMLTFPLKITAPQACDIPRPEERFFLLPPASIATGQGEFSTGGCCRIYYEDFR